jgi:hypothetical protein
VLLGVVAAIILLLYLVKPQNVRVVLPSTLLWRRVLRNRRRAPERWRWLLSLALLLTAGLSLALALTDPDRRALSARDQRIVLILDNSPSMTARMRDGASRWGRALEGARRIALQAGSASEIWVTDTMGRTRFTGFGRRDEALRQLDRLTIAPAGIARIPPLPSVRGNLQAHVFTDGVNLPRPPQGVIVHSVFEPAENVGITGFEAHAVPSDPTHYEAFVQIFNASLTAQRVRLELTAPSGFATSRELEIPADHSADQVIDVSSAEQGILRAQIHSAPDAFEVDDIAYGVVTPHRVKRVLLVTTRDTPLEDSLRSLPGIALSTSSPAAYAPNLRYDAYVFDRFAPSEAPPAGAILFEPPAAPWLKLAVKDVRKPAVLSWDEFHPISAGVRWGELRIERALIATPLQDTAAIVSAKGSSSGALVLTGRARANWIEVGFSLDESNFSLQPSLPIFLGSSLSWLTNQPPPLVEQIGHIEVPYPRAEVRDGAGRVVASYGTARGTAFDALRPDVFTVAHASGVDTVIANIRDPRYTQINRSWLSSAGPDRMPARYVARSWWRETSALLLLLAAALLATEWVAFARRITV